jgi:preprotein translocase subunit SecG
MMRIAEPQGALNGFAEKQIQIANLNNLNLNYKAMTNDLNFDNLLLGVFDLRLMLMQVLLFCVSLFLILLVLVQRGKGGGITGALGGMGGQSAFGSRAGDAFTKITVVTAIIWITLCMITIAYFNPPPRTANPIQPAATSTEEGAGETGAATVDGSNEGAGALPGEDGSEATGQAPAGAAESGSETPTTDSPSTEIPSTETPSTETPAADEGLSLPETPALPDASSSSEGGKQ